MVGEEDGEEFVTDVVQDIVQATLDVIYEKYIQQQNIAVYCRCCQRIDFANCGGIYLKR